MMTEHSVLPHQAHQQQQQVIDESLIHCHPCPISNTVHHNSDTATTTTTTTRTVMSDGRRVRMNLLLSLGLVVACFILNSSAAAAAAAAVAHTDAETATATGFSVIDVVGNNNMKLDHGIESSLLSASTSMAKSTTSSSTVTHERTTVDRRDGINTISHGLETKHQHQHQRRYTSKVTLTVAEQEVLRNIYQPKQHQQQPYHPKNTRFITPSQGRMTEDHGMKQNELPFMDETRDDQWQSLNPDAEFFPMTNVDPTIVKRFLEQNDASSSSSSATMDDNDLSAFDSIYNVQPFANGVDNYDEYQQAWRLLGFIIDCNPLVDDDVYGGGGGSGSGDKYTDDECSRYVLWAAVSRSYCTSNRDVVDSSNYNTPHHYPAPL
jgi:hypothetical protein